ncbi:transposase [Candidatus Kuenenia sp.]|uniref:transposase n=1 Tax=Candidatus Kuenenia sp. TaxID=2499824 RepID=UPI003220246C
MARPLRIQYKNALYLVTCQGDKRKAIFRDDQDKKQFLELLNDGLKTYTTLLHGYVLMENHFHLLLETPLANLSEFMKWINITYTAYYNKRYKRTGHLYQGRYKSILLEKKEYLDIVSRYIHLNPVNTRLGKKLPLSEKRNYLKNYAWSSLLGTIDPTKRNGIVAYAGVLAPYGGDNKKGRQLYWEAICSDLPAGIEIKDMVVGGNILGSTAFINRVRDKYLPLRSREILPARRLKNYIRKETIIKALCKETKKSFDEIKNERGVIRQIAMDLLYRLGGLSGTEIGEMMGIGYSTVSMERKRLRERLKGNRHLSGIIKRIEAFFQ